MEVHKVCQVAKNELFGETVTSKTSVIFPCALRTIKAHELPKPECTIVGRVNYLKTEHDVVKLLRGLEPDQRKLLTAITTKPDVVQRLLPNPSVVQQLTNELQGELAQLSRIARLQELVSEAMHTYNSKYAHCTLVVECGPS